MSEQHEILRRIAERGLKLAQNRREGPMGEAHGQHLDLWQHMLDEISRLPKEGSE